MKTQQNDATDHELGFGGKWQVDVLPSLEKRFQSINRAATSPALICFSKVRLAIYSLEDVLTLPHDTLERDRLFVRLLV